MTQDQYDTFAENIPAYVLGALSLAEAAALKRHLETCRVCQAELARYQKIGDGLLTALPLQAPSPATKGNLLAQLDKIRDRGLLKSKRRLRQFATLTIALVLLSINLVAFLQIRDLHQQQIQLARQIEKNHTLLGMLTASTEIHALSGDGISGNLLLDREKNLSYLLAWNMPPPPHGHIYQIWLISPDGKRIDAGTFRPEVDWPFTSIALVTSGSFAEFVGIEVTIEPLGGSDNPSGERILHAAY